MVRAISLKTLNFFKFKKLIKLIKILIKSKILTNFESYLTSSTEYLIDYNIVINFLWFTIINNFNVALIDNLSLVEYITK